MGRLLSEQKVLKKLGIPDFRHLTKDKVIVMASMLDRMDPEVAKKALEQFPTFAETAREVLIKYQETIDKGLESNDESLRAFYQTCNSQIEVLKKELERDTLSFEERKYIIDRLLEISRMMGEQDSKNKKFILGMGVLTGFFVSVIVAILASTLGGNTKFESNDKPDDMLDDEDDEIDDETD